MFHELHTNLTNLVIHTIQHSVSSVVGGLFDIRTASLKPIVSHLRVIVDTNNMPPKQGKAAANAASSASQSASKNAKGAKKKKWSKGKVRCAVLSRCHLPSLTIPHPRAG